MQIKHWLTIALVVVVVLFVVYKVEPVRKMITGA